VGGANAEEERQGRRIAMPGPVFPKSPKSRPVQKFGNFGNTAPDTSQIRYPPSISNKAECSNPGLALFVAEAIHLIHIVTL